MLETSPLKTPEVLIYPQVCLEPNITLSFTKNVFPAHSGLFEFKINLLQKNASGQMVAFESTPKYLTYQELQKVPFNAESMITKLPHITQLLNVPEIMDPYKVFHYLFTPEYERARLNVDSYRFWQSNKTNPIIIQLDFLLPCKISIWANEPEIELGKIQRTITPYLDMIQKITTKEKEKMALTNFISKSILTTMDTIELKMSSKDIKRYLIEILNRLIRLPNSSEFVEKYQKIIRKLDQILSRTLHDQEYDEISTLLSQTEAFIEKIIQCDSI